MNDYLHLQDEIDRSKVLSQLAEENRKKVENFKRRVSEEKEAAAQAQAQPSKGTTPDGKRRRK